MILCYFYNSLIVAIFYCNKISLKSKTVSLWPSDYQFFNYWGEILIFQLAPRTSYYSSYTYTTGGPTNSDTFLKSLKIPKNWSVEVCHTAENTRNTRFFTRKLQFLSIEGDWFLVVDRHCVKSDKVLHLARKGTINFAKLRGLNEILVCTKATFSFMLLNDWSCLLCSIVPYQLHNFFFHERQSSAFW